MNIDKQKESILEHLKTVPIVQVAVSKAGISRATFYRWKNSDHKFAEAVEKAVADGVLMVSDIAESQLVSAIKDKNLTGIIFWLKNHHKSYSDKIEINGKLEVENSALTLEQQALIKKALELAGLSEDNSSNP